MINQTDKINNKEKFKDGKAQSFLSKKAIEYDIWIIAGTIPIECKDRLKVRAASIVFNNKGEKIFTNQTQIHFDLKAKFNPNIFLLNDK